MIIDAHQHFWQLDQPFDYEWLKSPQLETINRSYLPDDLKPLMDQAGVSHSIFVQTQHNVEENRWVLKLADQHDWLAGVVGWVDLASTECESQLIEFKDHPKFVGIRHVTQDETDGNFIVRPNVVDGLRVLEKHQVPFDLLFYTRHLKHVATLARELPDLPMVINHLSKPEIKEQKIDTWKKDMIIAATAPNVFCKLSGMITEADWETWRPADLKPYIDVALECFGPERCMFGSDWPVCELAGSYQQVFDALAELLATLSESERAKIYFDNANRFYKLGL